MLQRQANHTQDNFGRIALRWGVLFIVLGLAGWVVTQDPEAPFAKMILVIILYIIVINLSIPLSIGYIGLTPIVAITTILDHDFRDYYPMIVAILGISLAELLRPLGESLTPRTKKSRTKWRDHLVIACLHIVHLSVTELATQPLWQNKSLIQRVLAQIPNTSEETFTPIFVIGIYFFLYLTTRALYWVLMGGKLGLFVQELLVPLISITFFAVPLTLFISSAEIGVPAFLFLSFSIITFATITRYSWTSRQVIEERLRQLSALNASASSLRETLDLPTVLAQLHEYVDLLIPSDNFKIALLDQETEPKEAIDDLTHWVIKQNKILELDESNQHHATHYQIKLPTPTPKVWLGVPLQSAEHSIGAMILQKFNDPEPFTQWNREILLAIASQASAAIQNARLYSETVRLYNLTDEALARRVEQLQALLYSINEGVLMVDREGKLVLINPKAAQLLGYPLSQLKNRTIETLSAESLGFTRTSIQKLLATLNEDHPITPPSHVYQIDSADLKLYIERQQVPVTSDDGKLVGWLIVFRDVTEERKRTEWRADLTRMIVHDLRNPITTISSSIDTIEGRFSAEQEQIMPINDLLHTAKYACNTLIEMVDSLLDINRAEAGKFSIDAEAMRLPSLIKQIEQNLQPLAQQRNITMSFEYVDQLPPVWGDKQLLRRVIVNLLDNALKFTSSGGKVYGIISAEPAHDDFHEEGARVAIYDNGPGIPAIHKERIFDRFITFNPGGGQIRGTGLGLTLCKLAIEAHGGRIWVEDAPHGGSVFIFTVPGIPLF